ncbi:MAG: divalent-cation tolerance protein CutA [Actinobacteria bacterium]|nr:divalent-cation tolerance protein CutA [Actinomycetota bacterium]
MSEYVQVVTATGSRDDALRIADALVGASLAACVQVVGPIASVYRWRGEVHREEEWLALAKTAADLYPEVESAILEIHPYEVPEVLAVPVEAGSADYLAWLREQVGRSP